MSVTRHHEWVNNVAAPNIIELSTSSVFRRFWSLPCEVKRKHSAVQNWWVNKFIKFIGVTGYNLQLIPLDRSEANMYPDFENSTLTLVRLQTFCRRHNIYCVLRMWYNSLIVSISAPEFNLAKLASHKSIFSPLFPTS